MKNRFTVRIYVNASSPMVVPGGRDPFGVYIETRQEDLSIKPPVSTFRMNIDSSDLTALPPGSDAEFEYRHPVPSTAF